jgi:hypothetical protein
VWRHKSLSSYQVDKLYDVCAWARELEGWSIRELERGLRPFLHALCLDDVGNNMFLQPIWETDAFMILRNSMRAVFLSWRREEQWMWDDIMWRNGRVGLLLILQRVPHEFALIKWASEGPRAALCRPHMDALYFLRALKTYTHVLWTAPMLKNTFYLDATKLPQQVWNWFYDIPARDT